MGAGERPAADSSAGVALEVVEQLLEHFNELSFEDAGRGELSFCPECGASSKDNQWDPKRELVIHLPACALKTALDNAEAFVRFVEAAGQLPQQDDLHRVVCKQAGEAGHHQCGWCEAHDKPRFLCGCLQLLER